MILKERIEQDLKTALLGGDKAKAMLLRGLKSTILNAEIAAGERDKGLSDDKVVDLLKKEVKSRIESADLYVKGGNQERANQELAEKALIEEYLPSQISDDELLKLVDDVIASTSASGPQAMGQVIGAVKQKTGGTADGARIAQAVKERLNK
ncbi:GatB/YqeY domain-containing protein [Candidatus Saccharibacteria bacterium]|nr:GatB/YqeY domain-containing protein [Candidatus Saccharibacteria bacterium]